MVNAWWELDGLALDGLVWNLGEEMADAVEAGFLFVVRGDDVPWGFRDVGLFEHDFLGLRVVFPAFAGLQIHGAELPLLEGVVVAALEAELLLFVTDGEPVFDDLDAGADEHFLKVGYGAEEFLVFLFGAEAHDVLDSGTVVPAAIKENHFACSGEVLDVALEIPLGLLAAVWCGEGGDPADAGVEALGHALDDAAFSG